MVKHLGKTTEDREKNCILEKDESWRNRDRFGEQGWHNGESTRFPPVWPGFDSWTRHNNYVGLCWFSTLLQGFFSGYFDFPPLAKTNTQLIQAGCWLCSKVVHGP